MFSFCCIIVRYILELSVLHLSNCKPGMYDTHAQHLLLSFMYLTLRLNFKSSCDLFGYALHSIG